MKSSAVLLLLVLLTALAGGCWSRREITELAIILGAGVDLTAGDQVRLTVQIARPGAFYGGGETGGRGGREPASWVVSSEGRTIEEAVRCLARKVPRHIYWSHCIVLIFGEEVARKGIGAVTNLFSRDRQSRETMWVMVAQGEAKDILETHSALEKTSAQAAGFLTRMRTSYSVQLREYCEMLASNGVQPALTRIVVREAGITPGPEREKESPTHKQVEISGVGVFKEDKLIGWLDAYETSGLLWLKGEARMGAVIVPSPGEPDKEVSIRVRRARTKIVPEYDGEHLRFEAKIRVEGDIVEQQSREDLARPDKIKALEKEMANEVKRRATIAVEKAQREYGVDIFGFGDAFHRKYKKHWRELKDRWDEEFAQAEIDIVVDARIREIGLTTKPVGLPYE